MTICMICPGRSLLRLLDMPGLAPCCYSHASTIIHWLWHVMRAFIAAANNDAAVLVAAIARMESHWHAVMAAHFEQEERLIEIS